ncbi:hypothetical protein KW805_03850 [Candidatus Pacearchaeota archaeon]|nr:hypothetical protein [Candidatus Pacearchaeota archaeon]
MKKDVSAKAPIYLIIIIGIAFVVLISLVLLKVTLPEGSSFRPLSPTWWNGYVRGAIVRPGSGTFTPPIQDCGGPLDTSYPTGNNSGGPTFSITAAGSLDEAQASAEPPVLAHFTISRTRDPSASEEDDKKRYYTACLLLGGTAGTGGSGDYAWAGWHGGPVDGPYALDPNEPGPVENDRAPDGGFGVYKSLAGYEDRPIENQGKVYLATINPGQRSVQLAVKVLDDAEKEGTESITLSLEASSAHPSKYKIGTSNSASVNIKDNE